MTQNFNEQNGSWKGYYHNFASPAMLHKWVRRRMPKPPVCPICKVREPFDLANITGVYNRDLENWQYQCRSCHMRSDGRISNLKKGRYEFQQCQ